MAPVVITYGQLLEMVTMLCFHGDREQLEAPTKNISASVIKSVQWNYEQYQRRFTSVYPLS